MVPNQNQDNNQLCYIKLPTHTKVYLDGIWDENIQIVSKALPQPASNEVDTPYYFRECTSCGQTYIFPTN